jgi:hypothetical protein
MMCVVEVNMLSLSNIEFINGSYYINEQLSPNF